MLVLGHAGITLGVAVLLNGAVTRARSAAIRESKPAGHSKHQAEVIPTKGPPSVMRPFSFTSLGARLDIRLLLIGSLLPDIIDKPVGQFFFRETFNNGRVFGHTLLFLIIITLAGYYLYRNRGKTWLLVLSLATFIHLVLDQMWLIPETLLWPGYGLAFPGLDLTYWADNMFHALLTEPTVYVPEAVGAVVLVAFMVTLVRQRKVYPFIRNGQLR